MGNDDKELLAVSIHAPVKGATLKHTNDRGLPTVSIHAPVKGATQVYGSFGN